jgi:hypothetical protein
MMVVSTSKSIGLVTWSSAPSRRPLSSLSRAVSAVIRETRPQWGQSFQQFGPRHHRHADIGQHEIGHVFEDGGKTSAAVMSDTDLETSPTSSSAINAAVSRSSSIHRIFLRA